MRKIGILCASDTELAPFLSHIRGRISSERAMLTFHGGWIGQAQVTAVYSGVCKVNAAIAAQLLIDVFGVEAILNAGTAGGMDAEVALFDTIVASRMVYHDVAEDILTEFHPWLRENSFSADPLLYAAAQAYSRKTAHPIRFGTVATGEQFIEDDRREAIHRAFAPLAVDMETTSVAHVCYVNRIPFLSVRTVTDTADHRGLAHFEQNCAHASARAAEVTLGILAELATHAESQR